MIKNKNVKLTTSEVAVLWAQYMSDSMGICVLRYFLNKVEDKEIENILEYALSLSKDHIKEVSKFFKDENIPIPKGFTDNDVKVDAPRLYSDTFFLFYLINMGKVGLSNYSVTLPNTARADIRKHFMQCITSYGKLYDKTAELMLSQGIYIRAPRVALTKEIDFVGKKGFISNILGGKRSLLAIEVTHIFSNMLTNIIGQPLLLGFSQVAKSKEVKEFVTRGKNISSKHVEVFSSILGKEEIPAPLPSEGFVSDSTISPFSDKLIMFHTTTLNAVGMGNYGTSSSMSLRDDLITHYIRLSAEIAQFVKDGVDIMIENKWLEQPPQVIEHNKLGN